MNQPSFWIGTGIALLMFSAVACWARQTGGLFRLTVVTAFVVAAVAVVGLDDWSNQSPRDTPVITYGLLAVLPAVLVATTVHSLATRQVDRRVQVLSAWLISFLGVIAALFSAFFP